jgi:hypothetical protein
MGIAKKWRLSSSGELQFMVGRIADMRANWAMVGCGGRRTLLATEVIFSVLICLCVMSDIRLSPSLEVRAACKNPLLAKSCGPCAAFLRCAVLRCQLG